MSHLMRLLLLQLCVISLFGPAVVGAQSDRVTSQPDAIVQNLYRQVTARHPLGIPSGKNWRVFAPFLSRDLIHRMTVARSCANDWARQNQGKIIKGPFTWGETGFFSGYQELSEPSSFDVQKTEANQDGSFRVYVKLTESPPNEKPWSWDVAVDLKMQEKRLVIEDVVFLKGDDVSAEYRLSDILAVEGCNGSHWIGDNKSQPQPK